MGPERCLTLTLIQSPQRIAKRKIPNNFRYCVKWEIKWNWIYTIDIGKAWRHRYSGVRVFHTPNDFNTCEIFGFLFFSFLFQCSVFLFLRSKNFPFKFALFLSLISQFNEIEIDHKQNENSTMLIRYSVISLIRLNIIFFIRPCMM